MVVQSSVTWLRICCGDSIEIEFAVKCYDNLTSSNLFVVNLNSVQIVQRCVAVFYFYKFPSYESIE